MLPSPAAEDGQESAQRHEPVLSRLHALITRGQASGEFDGDATPDWLAAATVALGHAAGGEVGAGRMTAAQGIAALRSSLLRVYGVALPPSGRNDP